MRAFAAVLFATSLLFHAGCATTFSGASQDVKIVSEPPGATFRVVETGVTGVTPAVVSLRRSKLYHIELERDGYQAQTVIPRREFNPLFLGNLLLVEPLWMIVDSVTGATRRFVDGEVRVAPAPAAIIVEARDAAVEVSVSAPAPAPAAAAAKPVPAAPPARAPRPPVGDALDAAMGR